MINQCFHAFRNHAFRLRNPAAFHIGTQVFKHMCFFEKEKLQTRSSKKNGLVIPYNVFEGSTCERTLQNHAFGVGETATLRITYVIYNSKSTVDVVF